MKLTDSAQKQLLEEIQTTLAEVQKTLLTHDIMLSEFVEYADKRDSNSLILSRLKDQVRIEVLADLLKQRDSAQEEVASLHRALASLQTKQDSLESEQAEHFKFLNSQLQTQTGRFHSIRQEHDFFISQLNLIDRALNSKASAVELDTVKMDINNCASAQSVLQLSSKLENCAPLSTLGSLQQTVNTLQSEVALIPSAEEVQSAIKRADSRAKARLTKYTRFQDVADAIASRETDLETRLAKLSQKVYQDTDMLGKRLTDLKKYFDKAPWQASVASVWEKLETKADQLDLDLLVERTLPMLQEVNSRIEGFAKRVEEFDSALARFDEIILTKASKEDLGSLDTRVTQCVQCSVFEEYLAQAETITQGAQERTNELAAAVERICQQLNSYGVSYEAQAKKNRELAWVVANVQELQQLMRTKADLDEIHSLRNTLGSQEDLDQLKNDHSSLDKMSKQALLVLAETLRSTLQSGESPRRKQQTRETLFNTAASLLNKSPPQRVTLRDTRPCSVKAGRPAILRSRLRVKANLHDQFGETFKTFQ